MAGEMDPLALFTHGEFRSAPSDQPELLLYTHGEFPRQRAATSGGDKPKSAAKKVGGAVRRKPPNEFTLEEIAIVMALLDDD